MENIPSIPRRFRGDRITADDHNNLAKAIANIARRIPSESKGYRPSFNEYHPFEFYNVRKDSGAWDVRIEPGFIIETNIQLSTATKTWTPEIGGTPMTNATVAVPIRMTIADGDEVYLIFETDEKGLISDTPEVAVDTGTGVQHHIPPSPGDSGTAGVYKIKIATCTVTNSVMFIEGVELRDNFYWENQLIELENVGSEAEVAKTFDSVNNRHPLRTLLGDGSDPGTGSDIHDLYITATQNADTIAFSGKVEIAGSGTASDHPWKATENGDADITIAAGEVIALNDVSGYPFTWGELSYAGGDIEVTAATGYIIISMVVSELDGGSTAAGDSALVSAPSSIAVEFVTAIANASDDFGYPICKVALAGGVATITKQILTHNPDPSVTWITPAP